MTYDQQGTLAAAYQTLTDALAYAPDAEVPNILECLIWMRQDFDKVGFPEGEPK